MSNEIFGTDIAQIVNDTFKNNLHPLTLHTITQGDPDAYGVPTTTTADHAGEGVRTAWKSSIVLNRGYPANTVKIIVLQNGIVTPTKNDEITILSDRYRIIDIEQDPVNATWSLAAVEAD
jgi:hypothetical protein